MSERVAPVDWGGASKSGYSADWGARETITEISCMDCSAGAPPDPVWFDFPGAWDKIQRAGCFEFHYGALYQFPQVCIDR